MSTKPEGMTEEMYQTQHPGQFIGMLVDIKPRLAESVFLDKYIALFVYREGNTEKNYPVMDWLEISGTPFMEVDIVSDTTGEVIYTIPPILDSNRQSFNDSLQNSIGKEAGMLHAKSTDMPGLENMVISEQYANQVKSSGANLRFLERWNEIFERYKLPKFPTKKSGMTNSATGETDEFDSEDLF